MPETELEQRSRNAPIECDEDMACLKGAENLPRCQVERPISDLLFVTAKPLPSCRWMRYFGDGTYCTCPVRKELYRRHKV
jgi:hypothetical protein